MTHRRFRSALATGLAVLALAAAIPATAGPSPDQKCRGTKLKSAGKYASAALGCDAKAAKEGTTTDPACVSKGAGKLTDAFAAAESKNAVDCNGLDVTSKSTVDEMAVDVAAAAPVPVGGGDCAADVRKAAGKFASSVLGAWSKFAQGGEATKRDAALDKARTSLALKIGKAETKTGCTAAGQAETVRVAVENGVVSLIGCMASADSCVESSEQVGAGGSSSSDSGGTGPDTATPVTAEVQTPNAGTVVLQVIDTVSTPPDGYAILGREVDITAPLASAAAPLVLTFVIDASLVPTDPSTVTLTRNGVIVGNCTGAPGTADPDPCVQSRTVLGNGDLEVVALTSHASLWTPLVALPMVCPTKMLLEARADSAGEDTATEIDVGWTGDGHDLDPSSGSPMTVGMDCSAATPSACGVCTITGFDPAAGNCRCANDPRTVCDEPLVNDADDCGGAMCDCYVRVPSPVTVNGTSTCLVSVAGSQVSGTWDVEAGSGDFALTEKVKLFLATVSNLAPCPVCVGDTLGDGLRGGTCDSGPSMGLPCEAQAGDPTFPYPGGGFYSLDCMPSPGSNLSGAGLPVARTDTTGTSTLVATLPCAGSVGGGMCPCAVCSGNTSLACSSDAQCAAASAGTCSSYGLGQAVYPDACGGGACVVDGNGEGTCSPADTSMYCDGILEEDGRGVLPCFDDSSCNGIDPAFGSCTVLQNRKCFGPTISATGLADPVSPRTVATTCLPPATSSAVNAVMGLPGPGRTRTDWTVTQVP